MRKVELTKGIYSSALGFGCAPILGSVGAEKSRRAIDCAIDCGVTHFDIARSYGYGEAENFVGKIIKAKRNQMVITTKFGIKANWKAGLLKPLKPLYRFAKAKLGKTKQADPLPQYEQPTPLPQPASNSVGDKFLYRIPFNAKEMIKSFEQSLKALNTEYIDYFLLHEPTQKIAHIEELTDTYNLLKKQGKLRAWGLAYMKSEEELYKDCLSRFDVLQFDRPAAANSYNNLVLERGSKSNILFSPFSNKSDETPRSEKLVKLFADFPNSVVLCSMFTEKHIIQNAGAAS